MLVSIHAPVRGATHMRALASVAIEVSIHAPVRGATCSRARAMTMFAGFNPRARAGRDMPPIVMVAPTVLFQSTRPCGARPLSAHLAAHERMFQSTRPCGARREAARRKKMKTRFQSTRPCGARRGRPCGQDH